MVATSEPKCAFGFAQKSSQRMEAEDEGEIKSETEPESEIKPLWVASLEWCIIAIKWQGYIE